MASADNTCADVSLTATGQPFEHYLHAVTASPLGSLLPTSVCQTLVEFSGGCCMYWSKAGDEVEISNHGLTARQTKSSRSVIGNVVFKEKTGSYWWSIRVDNISRSGCKYIGVVNSDGLETRHLNTNLQSGCSGRRIAWDGSCSRIYHDIDSYGSTTIGKKYKTGDIVTVHLDTDEKRVSFELNGEAIQQSYAYKGSYGLVPVIGFGYETNTEQYTLLECSWWGRRI